MAVRRTARISRAYARGVRALWLALGFLTVLPTPALGNLAPGELRRASGYFPLVGWVVGIVLWVGYRLFFEVWPPGLAAAGVLVLWLGITGMLHLDGLLDAADALLPPVSRERRLAILKDRQVGSFAFGVGAGHLLLKLEAIAAAGAGPLLLAPVFARFAVLLPMKLFPAARSEGLGAHARQGGLGLGTLFALPVFVLAPLAAGLALAPLLAVAVFAHRRLGGLSGDVYGALIELGELFFLLALLTVS